MARERQWLCRGRKHAQGVHGQQNHTQTHTLPEPSKRPRRGPTTTAPHRAATPASMCTVGGSGTYADTIHVHNTSTTLRNTCTRAHSVIHTNTQKHATHRGAAQGGCPASGGPHPMGEHRVDCVRGVGTSYSEGCSSKCNNVHNPSTNVPQAVKKKLYRQYASNLRRSATEPDTMVAAVIANTNCGGIRGGNGMGV